VDGITGQWSISRCFLFPRKDHADLLCLLRPGICIDRTQHPVTIMSTLSGWTTDFVPALFGGQDNLGTVVTQLTIVDQTGNYTGKLFTRDTIDLSQITTTGSAAEQDVIVGGTKNFNGAKGTYRVDSAPNQDASMVILTNLHGTLCTNN
jgi:hypothetical protein